MYQRTQDSPAYVVAGEAEGLVFHPYFLNLSSQVIKMALIIFLRLSDGHSLALLTFFLNKSRAYGSR